MEKTEKNCEDLINRYDILNSISNIVATSRELNKILEVTLRGVTFGEGFGFNRAMLFLIDEHAYTLKAEMAIGTETAEEAWKIWQEIREKNYSLEKFLLIERSQNEETSSLNKKIEGLEIPIVKSKIIDAALQERSPKNVDISGQPEPGEAFITDKSMIEDEILDILDHPRFCIIPLVYRTKKIGVLIVDNKYNNRKITQEDCVFLMMLGQFAASAIRNTVIYNELRDKINRLAKLNYQIKTLKEYNENIIESVHLNILVVGNDFKITACNHNFAKMLGLEKKDILGQDVKDYDAKIEDQDLVDEILAVMGGNNVKKFRHVKISMKQYENDASYNVTLTALRDSKNKRYGVIIIINDVTRTAELEKSLVESRRFSELGKLSASIAHEIRNPLIAIGGYANRIKKKQSQNQEINPENIQIIISEIARLERILDEILDYGSQKKTEYNFLNLNQVILDCLELVSMSAEQKNITLSILPGYDFLRSNTFRVYGSYNNLKQAFINVFNNAIEASSKSQTVTIIFNIVKMGKQTTAVLKVNNPAVIQNGKGINDIFAPFYTTKIHGTGLGLSITKKIIEEHLGSINVESDQEKGTTFVVSLPMAEQEDSLAETEQWEPS